jgi:hypothetical protein
MEETIPKLTKDLMRNELVFLERAPVLKWCSWQPSSLSPGYHLADQLRNTSMQTLIEFGYIRLSTQVESTQDIQAGVRLTGSQVAILHPFGKTRFYGCDMDYGFLEGAWLA